MVVPLLNTRVSVDRYSKQVHRDRHSTSRPKPRFSPDWEISLKAARFQMFDILSKRRNLTVHDVGQLIQRFLGDSLGYPQEWNEFVDTRQRKPASERYGLRCYE